MNADAKEAAFQQDIIDQMVAGGWKLGDPAKYDRKLALYTEDCLEYVKTTQPRAWAKYEQLYPSGADQAFIDKLAAQLSKADPQASDKSLRTYGTLGVLRHELRDKSALFKMCQFKPEHGLNPDTLAMYEGNILRVVPELVYSPYATAAELAETGKAAKKWRIDLVLFVNGIPFFVEWCMQCYIGSPGGHTRYGHIRNVSYSNTAAPLIEELFREQSELISSTVSHVALTKGRGGQMANSHLRERAEELLDMVEADG